MFDFLRNFGRSSEEKQQEALSAYLDNELAPAERSRLEQQLAFDSDLQNDLAEMQAWQQQMRSLPQRRVPRNFALDPALYGRPQRQPLGRAYPVLRTATAFTGILLVIALAANVFLGQSATMSAPQEAAMPLAEMAAEEAPMASVVQDEAEMAMEAPAVEIEMQEEAEMVVEEAPLAGQAVEEEADLAAEAPAETFLLEESAMEMEAAEAASDFAAETELLPQATPSLSPALEMVEVTALPPPAEDGQAQLGREMNEFLPQAESPAPEPEIEREVQQLPLAPKTTEPTAGVTELPPESASILPAVFSPLVIALVVLFILLAFLTLFARARR